MPIQIVVEDGTGMDNANSLASIQEFKDYFTLRGDGEAVSATDDDIAAGLILATDYMMQRFDWIGRPAVDGQALMYPACGLPNSAWDYDGEEGVVPPNAKKACIEYANRARPSLGAPLAPDQVFNDAGVAMNITKEKVGPIETEYQPLGGYSAKAAVIRPYPKADMYLKGLVYSSERTIRA